jgi:hypothetical protein
VKVDTAETIAGAGHSSEIRLSLKSANISGKFEMISESNPTSEVPIDGESDMSQLTKVIGRGIGAWFVSASSLADTARKAGDA